VIFACHFLCLLAWDVSVAVHVSHDDRHDLLDVLLKLGQRSLALETMHVVTVVVHSDVWVDCYVVRGTDALRLWLPVVPRAWLVHVAVPVVDVVAVDSGVVLSHLVENRECVLRVRAPCCAKEYKVETWSLDCAFVIVPVDFLQIAWLVSARVDLATTEHACRQED